LRQEFRVAPRPYWKGYLKLSLVSCSIALYPAASSSERVSFRQINKKTGNRLRQQMIDEVTRDVVPTEDKGRGYEIDKNVFIPVEDEELEALEVESNHTIEIDKFVPADQIDERYHDSPYYVAPTDKVGQEAFAVIREAMKGKGMVAIGRIVLAKRERPIMLAAMGKGLRAMTLRYPYEIRNEAEYFEDIPDVKISGEMLKLAEHIVASKAADFDPSEFTDRYEEAVVEMLRQKQAGAVVRKGPAKAPAAKTGGNVIDLLKRSLEMEKKRGGGRKAPPLQPALPKGKSKARQRARAAG
jgi:DNA end-binding protein Ku